jgi:hypothetical protein
MPRGDRTGPWGAGPMTGRGAGWCAGYDRPGFANPAPRLGLGWGCRGGGRGWRNMYYATGLPGWARAGYGAWPAPTADQELTSLKAQAGWLAGQLDAINKRIEELEGRGSPPAEP